ncbi:fungal-specific transcription factor domain-containing protein [Pseudomassariella vexata]|uniref:Fungal-specific transcription factor domain-domain-containing protein n=1 Tax=Pseudomassariella vexata TaxID=1141098 RepID=A0A1Y2ECQ6_9PEZI|nr:fungal-specific transcription factor domain-containing protein [Pseudomassariella vexata]ORY69026.1 fungal-specific transcription factor domain-domain-containing protein [Pseudomassariella vexata]
MTSLNIMGGNKHITTACTNCRRRKIKCDGKDTCSNCSMSRLGCVYNAEADMRRASTKKATNGLRARLAQLEQLLREKNIEVPPPSPENPEQRPQVDVPRSSVSEQESRSTMLDNRDSADGRDRYNVRGDAIADDNSGREGTNMYGHLNPSETTGPYYSEFGSFAPSCSNVEHNDQAFMLPQMPSPLSPPFATSTPGSESRTNDVQSEGDITDFLSARMGSLQIAEDGQLRYYGPTSNLHVHHSGFQSLSRSKIRHVASEGSDILRRLGLDREVPFSLEMHLARLYFAWEDPAIHVVDEKTFFAEKRRWLSGDKSSPYYSETLNNAICAIGANLAAGECLDVPEPAPEFFSSRAKALLDIEMDSPNVATVQALVVMSASEAAFTRDARGWLYSGMAARLSTDLGLHLDVTKHNHRGLLSQHDLDIRRTTFWGVFIHDNMWSLYVGRPGGIGIPDITVPRPPSHLDEPGKTMWKPYPMPSGQSGIPDEGIFFPLETCTDANITLCEFMRHINMTLYSGRMVSIEALVRFLIKTKKELLAWLENLPPALRLADASGMERPHAPVVLQLHMQFYATLISLYRPYLSSNLVASGETLSSAEDRAAIRQAASGCVSAAHQMAETLRCYRRQHSLRQSNIQMVHIIFTASLVYIYDVCTRTSLESQSSLNDLQLCCHSLGEIGQCYGNATRALEVIILVKSEWQRLSTARPARSASGKRTSVSMTADSRHSLNDGEDDRHKRRNRSLNLGHIGMDSLELPMFLMPPSSSTIEMLRNDHMGQPQPIINTVVPGAGIGDNNNAVYDAWQWLDRADLGMGNLHAPM